MPLPPLVGSAYWIEADEEATIYSSGSHDRLCRRSFLCYVLLRLKVVAHPADFWQSSTSHKLLFDPQAQPLLQPLLQLHLGDSPSIVEYIADRTDKLSRDRASSSANELEQYSRHGAMISTQAAILDDFFTSSGAVFPTKLSRDGRFRELLIEDLTNDAPFGPHVSCCIRDGLRRNEADRMIKLLLGLAHDRRRFVSVDGVISRLRGEGCLQVAVSRAYNRLQLLHWESRSNGNVCMPFVSRARSGAIDANDPEVFWGATDRLLGMEFQELLLSQPWSKAIEIASDLQIDPVWAGFIETYHAIVDVVEQNHGQIEELIVRTQLLRRVPGFWRIVTGIRPDKWTILSWTFHILSWLAGVPAGWSLAWRFGSAFTTFVKMLDHSRKVMKAYHTSDRHLLRTRIIKMMEDAETT